MPEEATVSDMERFSFIMQECIIQRLESVNAEKIRNHIHHLCCYSLVKFLDNFEKVKGFKVQSETVKQLDLALYIKKLLMPAHKSLIMMAAKLFL